MSPPCSTCGYAVEWLRSCYSSAWRLTNDPTVSSPGRYVFAAPSAPHFPTPHALWSRNWTTDTPDGLVGEVRGTKRPWRNGGLPVPSPPAVQLGSASCLAGGVRPAQLGQPTPLHGGFPAACWSAGQQPVPAPDPVLWLRPDELKPFFPGQLITFWPDASAYAHDASIDAGQEPTATLVPVKLVVPGLTVSWLVSSVLPVILAGDFALYWVLVPTADSHGTVNGFALPDASFPLGLSPLSFTVGLLRYVGSVDTLSIPYTPTINSRVLLSVIRTGNAVVFRINGTRSAVQVLAVVDPFTSVSVVPPMFGFPRLTPQQILELRAYDGTVFPSQDASIVNSLNARYTIF